MKHFLFLLIFTYTSIVFSQTGTVHELFGNKYEEFASYAKPSITNKLSKYFRNRIDSDLLDSYKISDTVKSKNYIYLTFRFNKQNKVTGINVTSPYIELNNSIKEAFKIYDIDDLNIPEKSSLNLYTLQILSKEGDKMVVNCSTNIVYDRYAVFEGCEYVTDFYQMKNCLTEQLKLHIANNISLAEIEKAKILGTLYLYPQFLVNELGAIEQINCKAPTDNLAKELNRVMSLFPKAKIPPTRNGAPTSRIYNRTISLQIDSDNKKYKEEIEKHKEEIEKSNDTLFNPNSELALHFKNYISQEELNKIVFPINHKSIYLSFNINKKGGRIDVKTNADMLNLNDRLVKIFNKFPFEKLNIKSTNILESYRYTIITQGYNKKIIECNDKPTVFIPPIFDENCEKSKTSDKLFDCLDQNISSIIIRKFEKNIKYKTTLTGIIRISCRFQIDTDGKIINIKASAPNPNICNELEQIIKDIPNVYKPAYLNGKAIRTNYNYSYRFNVGENKIDDFENLVKTYYKINPNRY